MKLERVLETPTPYQRAQDWAHWGVWEVFGDFDSYSDIDYFLKATEDGRIQAYSDETGYVDIGTWEAPLGSAGNVIIKVEHDLPKRK